MRCLPMHADHLTRSHHQQAIEFLARESQMSINEVARLYEDARAKLEVDARLTRFLGILAIRSVRDTLRERRAAKPTAA